jgi:hypothetical protein
VNSDRPIQIKKSGVLIIKGEKHIIIGTQNDHDAAVSVEAYKLRDEIEKEGIQTNWKDGRKKDTADLYVGEKDFERTMEIKKKLTYK